MALQLSKSENLALHNAQYLNGIRLQHMSSTLIFTFIHVVAKKIFFFFVNNLVFNTRTIANIKMALHTHTHIDDNTKHTRTRYKLIKETEQWGGGGGGGGE